MRVVSIETRNLIFINGISDIVGNNVSMSPKDAHEKISNLRIRTRAAREGKTKHSVVLGDRHATSQSPVHALSAPETLIDSAPLC
jgi:hypothetical protein